MSRRARQQAGTTLIEVTVAMALVSVVLGVFLPTLVSATKKARPLQVQSESVDELRRALASIGRELRSAECVAEPLPNVSAIDRLRFTTHANNRTYEVTYRVEGGQLLRQETGQATAQVAADFLVADPAGAGAFEHIATPRRTVNISFHVQINPQSRVRDISTVIAGRNAWRVCA